MSKAVSDVHAAAAPGLCPGPHQEGAALLDLRQGQWPLDPWVALGGEVANTDLERSRSATSPPNAINRSQRASPFGGGSQGGKATLAGFRAAP